MKNQVTAIDLEDIARNFDEAQVAFSFILAQIVNFKVREPELGTQLDAALAKAAEGMHMSGLWGQQVMTLRSELVGARSPANV